MNPREQIGHCRHLNSPKLRKYMKRSTAKAERREAKRYKEDAPPRHYFGWID